ncbi:MAG TPA: hypothetical protein VFF79_12720 [Conexibacter sp.]|jgi:hypothetical protein|nr:hypothetical protein [Conexibacter sp.]
MTKKTAARAAQAKPCEHCGHCPTCGHRPHEVVKVVPMPYPVPAPQPVYPWGYRPYRPYWQIGSPTYVGGGFGAGGTYVNGVNVPATPLGTLVNCN